MDPPDLDLNGSGSTIPTFRHGVPGSGTADDDREQSQRGRAEQPGDDDALEPTGTHSSPTMMIIMVFGGFLKSYLEDFLC